MYLPISLIYLILYLENIYYEIFMLELFFESNETLIIMLVLINETDEIW